MVHEAADEAVKSETGDYAAEEAADEAAAAAAVHEAPADEADDGDVGARGGAVLSLLPTPPVNQQHQQRGHGVDGGNHAEGRGGPREEGGDEVRVVRLLALY